MKKWIGWLAIMLWAQAGFSQQHFGVKAGFNLAWQKSQVGSVTSPFGVVDLHGWKPDIKPLAGYEAGFFYHIPLADHWLLSAEANLSMKGTKAQVAVIANGEVYRGEPKFYGTFKLYYLDIPLTVQYKIRRFTAGAGPSAGLLAYSRTIVMNSVDKGGNRTFDAGANLLAGYQLAPKWKVDLRYYNGFTNLSRKSSGKVYNRCANLSLLYTLK